MKFYVHCDHLYSYSLKLEDNFGIFLSIQCLRACFYSKRLNWKNVTKQKYVIFKYDNYFKNIISVEYSLIKLKIIRI